MKRKARPWEKVKKTAERKIQMDMDRMIGLGKKRRVRIGGTPLILTTEVGLVFDLEQINLHLHPMDGMVMDRQLIYRRRRTAGGVSAR